MNELDILKKEKELREKRFETESLKNNLITQLNTKFSTHGEDYLKKLGDFNKNYGKIKN